MPQGNRRGILTGIHEAVLIPRGPGTFCSPQNISVVTSPETLTTINLIVLLPHPKSYIQQINSSQRTALDESRVSAVMEALGAVASTIPITELSQKIKNLYFIFKDVENDLQRYCSGLQSVACVGSSR
jgi:hypothetical protein